MLHLRVIAPEDMRDDVLAVLRDEVGVANILLFPGAAGDRLRTGAPDAGRLLETGDVPTDEALDQARQRVLADLDAPGLLRTGGQAERLAHRPNPRLVSPQDLANSPGTRLLGRLMGGGV